MRNDLQYASFLNRALAFFIDVCIWMLISAVFVEVGNRFLAVEIVKYIDSVTPVLYLIFFIYIFEATPGKMFMKIKVVSESGAKMNLTQAILRETVGKFISLVPLCFGYLWVLADDRLQSFHDKIARTVVVKEEEEES